MIRPSTPTITPKNALRLSAWIATQHPGLFRQLLAVTSRLQASPLGRFGYFGDDVSLSDVGVDVPDVSVDTSSAIDTAALTDFTPTLTDVGTSSLDVSLSSDTGSALDQAISPADSTSSDSGFWSGIGQGAASVAGGVAKVAGALLSPQTMTAAATAASAYFKSQATTAAAQAQAQTQQAILNAQLQRVAQGYSPAPVSYVRNPATGQMVPVYNTPAGGIPVTSGLLGQLANPLTMGLSSVSPTVWMIGGGLLLLSIILSNRS